MYTVRLFFIRIIFSSPRTRASLFNYNRKLSFCATPSQGKHNKLKDDNDSSYPGTQKSFRLSLLDHTRDGNKFLLLYAMACKCMWGAVLENVFAKCELFGKIRFVFSSRRKRVIMKLLRIFQCKNTRTEAEFFVFGSYIKKAIMQNT